MNREVHFIPHLILVWGFFSYSNGLQVNLTFSCQGYDGAATVENGYDILKICGDSAELSMVADEDLNMAEVTICFLENTTAMSNKNESMLMKFTIGGYSKSTTWTPSDVSMVIDNAHLPCGSGYLRAQVRSNGMVIATEYERAIRICDNSDIDISLHIDAAMKTPMKPQLYTGMYSNDLLSQLSQYMDFNKAVLRNLGNRTLPNATMETPHMVAVYLTTQKQMMQDHGGKCLVPTYTIVDQLIGQIAITDAIKPGKEFNIVPHFHGHYIPEKSSVCGDAELVIFYDPLKINNDDDECNDFTTVPVHVTCSSYDKMDDCVLCPNPIDTKTWALFSNMTFYEYNSMDEEWKGTELRMMSMDTKEDLVHAGMSQLMQRHLSGLYSQPHIGLCMFVGRAEKDTMMKIQKMEVHEPRILDGLEDRLQWIMNAMQTYKDVSSEMESLQMWGDSQSDPVNKSLITGSYTGLAMIQSINLLIMKSQFMGEQFPANTTRLIYGQMLRGLAQINHMGKMYPMLTNMYGMEVLKYAQAARLLTFYLHQKNILPENIAHSLMKLTKYLVNKHSEPMSNDTGSSSWQIPSMVSCPFEQQVNYVTKAILTFANGWDGEEMTQTTQMKEKLKMGMCSGNILRVFLLKGGHKVVRKAFLRKYLMEKGMKLDDLKKIPKKCRRSPLEPYDAPLEHYIVNDDGKIMKGAHNPIQQVFTHKVIATCHCKDTCTDNAMGGSTSMGGGYPEMGGSNGMWTTASPSWMQNDMWGTTLPSWVTSSPMIMRNNRPPTPPMN